MRLILALLLLTLAGGVDAQTYFPAAGEWERRTPEQVGLRPTAIADAVMFAQANESTSPRDLHENHLRTFGREPHGEAIGPFRDRGPASGIIVRNGYIVAEWGEPDRVDNTFSVTKSFLSTVVGLAWDRGLVGPLDTPVRSRFAPVLTYPDGELLLPFESAHNAQVTWDHLLRQSSEWTGTLWGKPDWADRPRGDLEQWRTRDRPAPGAVYTYNDVRVNLLALAALNVWRRPLPEVLREHVMDPIGASSTWRWFGYDNSWVVLDGALVQSVSGGAHWGGGMFISARDMARFGLLTLHEGQWDGRRIVSEEWLRLATTPGTARGGAGYGFMNFFLNVGERPPLPSAPQTAFYHLGAGNNIIYVDRANDIVIVMRWISSLNAADGVVQRVLDGITR